MAGIFPDLMFLTSLLRNRGSVWRRKLFILIISATLDSTQDRFDRNLERWRSTFQILLRSLRLLINVERAPKTEPVHIRIDPNFRSGCGEKVRSMFISAISSQPLLGSGWGYHHWKEREKSFKIGI
jgi:hypothetical protein